MLRRLLHFFGYLAYGLVLIGVIGVSSYLSFSRFIRSGVTSVPQLKGLTEEQAELQLREAGLVLQVAEGRERYDEDVLEGHVMRQDPKSGSLVKQDSAVEVMLSRGQELVEVPDLSGQALQAAQVTLSAMGLSIGGTSHIYCDSGKPGTVVEQSPAGGLAMDRSIPLVLYLCGDSLEERYLMPDLIYRNYEVARRFLERQGFRFGNVKYELYEGIETGVVLRQYPLPGHLLRRQDVISMVVATAEGFES